ncbi:hypothetical protein CYMTET_14989 [Cymbomonas tetramitiformis]|uniref:Uncharacterized protein n=1 Tax=Cymbomonas tetramitiformis TaxID=36881 RepID=A0AAE0L9D3_9CHLO|nr:hypothetical protein CYMTET_14989 [Cymbomonas tetramitiformis]
MTSYSEGLQQGSKPGSIRDISCSLLHHLFCELKLGERVNEESALAATDLALVLTAQMDEHPVELQDTEAC